MVSLAPLLFEREGGHACHKVRTHRSGDLGPCRMLPRNHAKRTRSKCAHSIARAASSAAGSDAGRPDVSLGYVIDGSGICVPNATIEIVDGQGVGQRIRQETPCGAWDYGGGFTIKELTSGIALTVRASAPGFVTQEETFVPTPGPMYQAVFLTLSRE
jgi:hypothetical protein